MPRGDRRGPLGQGTMTGRGMGICNGNVTPGYTNGGGYWGQGRGSRSGFGSGRGFGMGRPGRLAWQGDFQTNTPNLGREEEVEILKEQVEQFGKLLENANKKIETLQNNAE